VGYALLLAAVMFLTAYLVTTLAERLRMHERRLRSLAKQAWAEKQLLVQALETTGTALRVLDTGFKTDWSNELWNQWFAAKPGRQCGAGQKLDGPGCPARACQQDGQVRTSEVVVQQAEGCQPSRNATTANQRVFQLTTAPLTDSSGRIHQVVELAQDVTQQRETQAQMIRASRMTALGELAGQLVHEINNPVAVISGRARLLLSIHEAELSPDVAQEITKIADTADRIARLARNLLDVGRLPSSTREPLDLTSPVRKALGMIESKARRHSIEVQDRLPETMPAVVGNAGELEQVFLNLLLNAVDALPKGGWLRVSAQTTAASANDSGWVSVTVEDNGVGIPADVRERIFEPFFTTKPAGSGTGLGLAICQRLLRNHLGVIEVRSEPGKGTCFTVKLPALPADLRSS